jgi:hypothetical protein
MPDAAVVALERAAVIAAGIEWIGTPFHHDGAVKGAGCDCSHLALVYKEVVGAPIFWPSNYQSSPQWFIHADVATAEFKEIYLEGAVSAGFVELSDGRANFEPFDPHAWIDAKKEPGDFAIARLGRLFAHGAIIESWPNVIQAEPNVCGRGKVVRATANANYWLSNRAMRFFSWKGWH